MSMLFELGYVICLYSYVQEWV